MGKDRLQELNEICDNLNEARQMNERAHLMSIYFSLCAKVANREIGDLSQNPKLNREDFDMLMDRLDSKNRKKIQEHGGFAAMDVNSDQLIDCTEFIRVIDKILGINDDEWHR